MQTPHVPRSKNSTTKAPVKISTVETGLLAHALAHGVNSRAIIIRLYSRMCLEYNHFFAPTSDRMSL